MQYFEITKEGKLKNKPDKEFPPQLDKLNLMCWNLTDISDVIFPQKLRYLNLDFNNLTDISNSIFPPQLKILNLYQNNLTDISDVIFPQQLQHLNLGCNISLTDISYVIFPPKLQKLILNFTNLTEISNARVAKQPGRLSKTIFPPELQDLYLSRTPLKDISNVIFPKKLKYIQLTGCDNLPGILGIFPESDMKYINVCKKIRIVQRQIRKWYWKRKIKENKISLYIFDIAYDMDFKHSFIANKCMKSFKSLSGLSESKFE